MWSEMMYTLLFLFLTFGGLIMLSTNQTSYPDCVTTSTQIRSLALGTEQRLSGTFILGFGAVSGSSTPKYWFYESSGGGWVLSSSIAETTILKEDAWTIEDARIERIQQLVQCNMLDGQDGRWVVHVPKGTIIQDYSADTKEVANQ